jgi:hypothetical protein
MNFLGKLENSFVRTPNIVYTIDCPGKTPAIYWNLETPWLEDPNYPATASRYHHLTPGWEPWWTTGPKIEFAGIIRS